jgi:hypothetical protein
MLQSDSRSRRPEYFSKARRLFINTDICFVKILKSPAKLRLKALVVMNASPKGKIYVGIQHGTALDDFMSSRGWAIRMFANMLQGLCDCSDKRRRALDKASLNQAFNV